MVYCNNRLEYKESIRLSDNSRLSIYQKVYKYSDNEEELFYILLNFMWGKN